MLAASSDGKNEVRDSYSEFRAEGANIGLCWVYAGSVLAKC